LMSPYSILSFSIDVKLQPQYYAFTTCYDVWNKVKRVYSNDDHLTKQAKDIPCNVKPNGYKLMSPYSILWFSIDVKLQPQYYAFTTCYDVWNKVKRVYSNDVYRLYNVVSNLTTVKLENIDIQTYFGKLDCVIADFESLMPFANDVDKHAKPRSGKRPRVRVYAAADWNDELNALVVRGKRSLLTEQRGARGYGHCSPLKKKRKNSRSKP